MKYFTKFWNTKTLFQNLFFFWSYGLGWLVCWNWSQNSRNYLFASVIWKHLWGSVLLFVIGTLLPVAAQSVFLVWIVCGCYSGVCRLG